MAEGGRVQNFIARPLGFFLLTGVFTAIGVWMVARPSPGGRLRSSAAVSTTGWVVIAFFGLGGLWMLVQWLRADRPGLVADVHKILRERKAG